MNIKNRHKNIDKTINEINEIRSKYDLVLEKSTTTGAHVQQFNRAYNSRNDSDETNEFFYVVQELYDLAGYHHIGSGILYTHYYKTDDWENYQEAVLPLIEFYIENNL